MPPPDYPTTIRLDPYLKAALRGYARNQGASLSWLITDILRKWLQWRRQSPDAAVTTQCEDEDHGEVQG